MNAAIRTTSFAVIVLILSLVLAACGGSESSQGSSEPLTVYSGRSQALVEGLVERFEEQADFPVNLRYGKDAQLVNALREEGEQSDADLFWANTTGALGTASETGMLTSLPDSIMRRPASYAPEGNQWVPVTARFRVLAYNTNAVDSTELPSSVWELRNAEQFEGRIGWTPAYSSFQDFLTAMRSKYGPDSTRTWLRQMQQLNPESYTSNTPMILDLADGELDVALTNHYYVQRLKHGGGEGEYEGGEEEEEREEEEEGESQQPDAPVATHHFETGDAGNLALVTGAGVLQASRQQKKALRFLSFLLSKEAQQFAAQQVNEYPVTRSAGTLPDRFLPVDQAMRLSPQFDYEKLRNMDPTLSLMREEGLL
jgi:iron(III) transport system substrate-binding protein